MRISPAALLLVTVLVTAGPSLADTGAKSTTRGSGEVEVLRTGNRVMYRYVDENGDLVIQDRPPAWYVMPQIDAGPDPQPRDVRSLNRNRQGEPDVLAQTTSLLAAHAGWAVPLLLVLAALRLIRPPLPGRALPTDVPSILRSAGLDAFHDLVLPLQSGGVTRIDHLARTASGLLVLQRELATGTISGRPQDPVWRETCGGEQRHLPNPIASVDVRIEAVRALAPDLPIFGRVVFVGGADFSEGAPAGVLTLHGLRAVLPRFQAGKVPPTAMDTAWQVLGRHAGRDARRVPAGRTGLARPDPQRLGGFALLGLALILFVVL